MRLPLTSMPALLVFAIGVFIPATTAIHFKKHIAVTRFRDNACRTASLDRNSYNMPKHGGLALRELGKCYTHHDRRLTHNEDVFHSISWRWADTGLLRWQATEVDNWWQNCTLFVYEMGDCDERGRVRASWYVDKFGMQNRCWGFGDEWGAKSLMLNCVGQ